MTMNTSNAKKPESNKKNNYLVEKITYYMSTIYSIGHALYTEREKIKKRITHILFRYFLNKKLKEFKKSMLNFYQKYYWIFLLVLLILLTFCVVKFISSSQKKKIDYNYDYDYGIIDYNYGIVKHQKHISKKYLMLMDFLIITMGITLILTLKYYLFEKDIFDQF